MSERFTAVHGRKVVSRASAEELGTVSHLLVDTQRRRVVSLVVGKPHAHGGGIAQTDLVAIVTRGVVGRAVLLETTLSRDNPAGYDEGGSMQAVS